MRTIEDGTLETQIGNLRWEGSENNPLAQAVLAVYAETEDKRRRDIIEKSTTQGLCYLRVQLKLLSRSRASLGTLDCCRMQR